MREAGVSRSDEETEVIKEALESEETESAVHGSVVIVCSDGV